MVSSCFCFATFSEKKQTPHFLGHKACRLDVMEVSPSPPNVWSQHTQNPTGHCGVFRGRKASSPISSSWGLQSKVGVPVHLQPQNWDTHLGGQCSAAPPHHMSNTIAPLVPLVQSLGACLNFPNLSRWLIRTIILCTMRLCDSVCQMPAPVQWRPLYLSGIKRHPFPACRNCSPIGEGRKRDRPSS